MMARVALLGLSFGVLLWMNPLPASATDLDWELVDIHRVTHDPFADESTRAIVLVFISPDCPIANSYQPLLRRLADEYEKVGVRFFQIHPTADVTIDQARKHAHEFGIKSPVILDSDQEITLQVGATVTPQAFVFARGRDQSVYEGRIDNLYAGYGKKRNVATTRDLGEALDAVVAGRLPSESKTEAIGCYISYTK